MAFSGLIKANNLSDITNKERAWDNLGQSLFYGGNGDPYFNSVTLLLHGDGNYGDQAIDSSLNSKTVVNNGGAVISASQKKFGQSSLYIPNVNSFYNIAPVYSEGIFGTDDFTIETFAYSIDTGLTYQRYLDLIGLNDGTFCEICLRISVGTYRYFVYAQNGAFLLEVNSGVPAKWNTWSHHALVRNGNTWKYYIDGINYSTNTISFPIFVNNTTTVGCSFPSEGSVGYFDEIRLTKRIARYTSNFTPPTAAFPGVLGNKIFTIKGKEVLALNDVNSVSPRDFVFVKNTFYPVQPRLNAIAQNVTYGATLSNTLLLKQSPSSIGNYLVASGTLNAGQLKTNGVPSASLSSSPFSGSSALFPLSIATMEMSSNFRLASVFSSGTIASPTIAMPVETNDFYLYAKTGQN